MESTHQHQATASSYVKIWAILVALTFASGLAANVLGHGSALLVAIFSIAAVKATLVALRFMHLRHEPLVIWVGVMSALAVVVLVFFGLIPDIVYQFGRIPVQP